jgi:hypothetical protein
MTETARCRGAVRLHDYMTFRAARERMGYELSPEFFFTGLACGCRCFFGIEVNERGQLVADAQNPEAFSLFCRRQAPRLRATIAPMVLSAVS